MRSTKRPKQSQVKHPNNTFPANLCLDRRSLDKDCIIAQRIKRLSSIEAKLERFPTMTLSQMQDIGGCRAILKNVGSVKKLCAAYANSQIKHKLHHKDDYIDAPKESGYRGVHLVYRYQSDKRKEYNSQLIEMQIRSQLQHAWATAVEVFGAFVNQALKSSIGQQEYLRFFSLMGSAIANMERTTLIPNTPARYRDLIVELREHEKKLDIGKKLAAFGTAVKVVESKKSKSDHFYLVVVDNEKRIVSVTNFPLSASKLAADRYLEAERAAQNNPNLDAVLVSVDSMAALQRAYPNYFLDTRLFTSILSDTIKRVSPPRKSLARGQLPLL